jgi:hypothetical protein
MKVLGKRLVVNYTLKIKIIYIFFQLKAGLHVLWTGCDSGQSSFENFCVDCEDPLHFITAKRVTCYHLLPSN